MRFVTRAGRVGSRLLDLGFQWNEPAYLLTIALPIHDGIFGIGSGSALARARAYMRPDAKRNRYYEPCFPVGTSAHTKIGSPSEGGRGGFSIWTEEI